MLEDKGFTIKGYDVWMDESIMDVVSKVSDIRHAFGYLKNVKHIETRSYYWDLDEVNKRITVTLKEVK
jgi:hypothetical protein